MGSEEKAFLRDLGGAARKSVRILRKRLPLPAPKAVVAQRKSLVSTSDRIVAAGYSAHLAAAANVSAVEQMRPNAIYTLISSTPATAVASGAATNKLSVSIPGDFFICGFGATAADEADFLMTSLTVDGFELVKSSSGVNLSAFLATASRADRPVPLVGRKFNGPTVIEGNFLNTNAAARVFHGLTITTITTECLPNTKKTEAAPFMFNLDHVTSSLRGLMRRRK